jgi:hypothetical protein
MASSVMHWTDGVLFGVIGVPRTHPAEYRTLHETAFNLRTSDGSQRLTLDDYEDLYTAQEAIFRRGQEEGDFDGTLDPRLLAVT